MQRASQAESEILDKRDPTELPDNALLTAMLAEAYSRGFVAGHAADYVRIEAEATKGELAH